MNKNVLIICRSENPTVDFKKTSLRGLLTWGLHLEQKYLIKRLSDKASISRIKARILANTMMPEWIGNHRFGIFDLLNYVKNRYRYVYDPTSNSKYFDPIGIPSITSIHIYDYLLKNNYKPIFVDNFEGNSYEIKQILKDNPLAVVISATFMYLKQIKRIIYFIRRVNKHVPIVVGGSILLSKLDSNKRLEAEYEAIISKNVYIILDEYGLDTLNLLLNRILEGGYLADVPNMAYLDGNIIKYTKRKETFFDINAQYPEWANVASITKDVAFIRASQGCVYKCKFCTFPKASIKFRQRSVESVRNELRNIRSVGIKNVLFTDDNLVTNPRRLKEICNMMKEEKFDFNWSSGIRASAINEDNAKLLAETGCKVICIGLESGDDRILKLMNKKTTTLLNMKCLEILDKHKIVCYGSFILGFPGETDETLKNTIDWINSSPLKLYKVFLFFLPKNSIIYDEQDNYNISYFGGSYDSNLWKTPTMDGLRASELLKEFILRIEKAALSYSNSAMYAFFPFLSKGYSISETLDFLRIRTELIKNELSNSSYFSKRRFRKIKLGYMEELLKKASN